MPFSQENSPKRYGVIATFDFHELRSTKLELKGEELAQYMRKARQLLECASEGLSAEQIVGHLNGEAGMLEENGKGELLSATVAVVSVQPGTEADIADVVRNAVKVLRLPLLIGRTL